MISEWNSETQHRTLIRDNPPSGCSATAPGAIRILEALMSRVPLLREIAGNKLWRTRGSHRGTKNVFFNSLPSYFFVMHQYTIKMLVELP